MRTPGVAVALSFTDEYLDYTDSVGPLSADDAVLQHARFGCFCLFASGREGTMMVGKVGN